mmetsp:Transcript_22381/g.38248  ORF Transcript_22381/g.38248 Transcript_22381/m.38248 type:complete len:132 (+) Transcript_22381:1-396(+)
MANATIGTDIPDQVKQCMRSISAMTPEVVQSTYGYPNLRMASAIHNRSTDLLAQGFEWSLLYSQPTNQPMHRYKIAPSCCAMSYDPGTRRYNCNTSFVRMSQIPFGNPWHGGAWHGAAGKDTGSYTGGTAF